MILKRLVRWSLVLLFWLFLLGWGISVFAAEWMAAPSKVQPVMTSGGQCRSPWDSAFVNVASPDACDARTSTVYCDYEVGNCYPKGAWVLTQSGSVTTFTKPVVKKSNGAQVGTLTFMTSSVNTSYFCPPDGSPLFTVGPKDRNGQKVCEKAPISCKVGEQLFMNPTTGAETCKANCGAVTGQTLDNVAYNQAFLPSQTVTCYGLCSVTSSGVTIGNPTTFEQFGNVSFTGQNCPVTFPAEGTGQPTFNNQASSSASTNAAQNQLQNAASGATSNQVSGATGTADLNAVVNKLAETSNAQIKAMSEQNAAMGKVIEGVGKDIQGAIREGNASGGGAGNSVGQMQTANAIKEGNQTLKEIKDKLDEQQNPEPPVSPGTNLDADAKSIHEANDWGARNFGTVLTANATRFRALPIFALPTNFFTVNLGGNACPTYSGSFTVMGSTNYVTFDAFCSSTVMNVMPFIRAVVMMVFGWLAWRIAIGNGG